MRCFCSYVCLWLKGEVNLNIKLHLNDSFYTLINKYHPHITKFCVVLKKFTNFEVILHTYKLVLLSLKIGTIYHVYLGVCRFIFANFFCNYGWIFTRLRTRVYHRRT